jgi:hypothetical protein
VVGLEQGDGVGELFGHGGLLMTVNGRAGAFHHDPPQPRAGVPARRDDVSRAGDGLDLAEVAQTGATAKFAPWRISRGLSAIAPSGKLGNDTCVLCDSGT